MQDRPSPAELVKAVAAFLQTTIMPQSVGRVAFETRVAINALELVARQLTGADESHTAERLRLERGGVASRPAGDGARDGGGGVFAAQVHHQDVALDDLVGRRGRDGDGRAGCGGGHRRQLAER